MTHTALEHITEVRIQRLRRTTIANDTAQHKKNKKKKQAYYWMTLISQL